MEPDRISKLPDNVIENILSKLTIRDAVRTSVLSTTWRYKWASIPSFVFSSWDFPRKGKANFGADFAKIVDHVLSLHVRPILKFKLYYSSSTLPDGSIDQWILYLSRNSLKEFVLRFQTDKEPPIPSCLFSCQSLTHLTLDFCVVTLPLWFKGFPNLKSLNLDNVTLSEVGYEKLIAGCPVLESLDLTLPSSFHTQTLNVEAPYLRKLEIQGYFSDVTLQNMPHLAVASIYKQDWYVNPMNLLKSLATLPKLRQLELGEDITGTGLPEKTPKLRANIQHLSIDFHLLDLGCIVAAFDLLQCVPNLEELDISLPEQTDGDHEKLNRELVKQNRSFTKLRCMGISSMSPCKQYEIDFIGYMLLCSPVLEDVIVTVRGKKFKLANKLLGLRRASPLARIKIEVDYSYLW